MKKLSRSQLAAMNIQYRYYPLTVFFDDAEKYGFRNVELWGAAPHIYPEDMTYHDIMAVRHEAEKRKLKIICYTPEQCVYPVNLAAPSAAERRRSLKFFEDSVRTASELGADRMLVTSGTGYYDGSDRAEAWKYAAENLSALCRMAGDYQIRLALEVLRKDESNLVNDLPSLTAMLSEIQSETAGGMIDTIPMALAGETPEMYIKALGKRLIHIHFIDGAPRGHLAWGDGILDLEKYVSELEAGEYQGNLTLEITDGRYFMEPWKSLEQSMRVLSAAID